jgi:hypothetical protein
MTAFGFLIVVIACVWGVVYYAWSKPRRLKRAAFIRTYEWPRGLLDGLEQRHPALTREDTARVSRGLKQFFITHLMSGGYVVAMPSRIVDELWHEFILHTREYQHFCDKAFGRFMHHRPAVTMGSSVTGKTADGLRRAWWFACKDEGINPKQATRLPLLFALDGELQIPNGMRYDLDCDALRKTGVTNVHCTTDFFRENPGCNSD